MATLSSDERASIARVRDALSREAHGAGDMAAVWLEWDESLRALLSPSSATTQPAAPAAL